jgi:hypothetical protein
MYIRAHTPIMLTDEQRVECGQTEKHRAARVAKHKLIVGSQWWEDTIVL